ncbi:hypothetical protein B0H13DRAFT_2312060 [Mycena leptocephala]|nr:hypothetical protein B0H13DRAFT_2312060 [Mycena leptocephala]
MSEEVPPAIFEEATRISPNEIKAYRKYVFPTGLSDPNNVPFFSVEDAPIWITSLGYQLYLVHDDSEVHPTLWNAEDVSMDELRAYRTYMVNNKYHGHAFFSLENTDAWISPQEFHAFQLSCTIPGSIIHLTAYSHSRASSRASFAPSSRAGSPDSIAGTRSRPPSAMSIDDSFPVPDSAKLNEDTEHAQSDERICSASVPVHPRQCPIHSGSVKAQRKGKPKPDFALKLTRELGVDEIVELDSVPSTFTVPERPTAYLFDLTESKGLLTTPNGKALSLDAYIRSEDQDSWRGSTGHVAGDSMIYCNGVETCDLFDENILAGCQRFEPDEDHMRELWNHELDANAKEASLAVGIISRFYARIMNSKCKVECNGVPVLVPLQQPSKYGKQSFVGCSNWSAEERFEHICWPIPANCDENTLKPVIQNNGLLPTAAETGTDTCVLTVHPRVGLKNCPYTHIVNGRIYPAKIRKRPCDTQMIIFIPIEGEFVGLKALVIVRNPHNHPVHPRTKPSAQDRMMLGTAVESAGLTGLTVRKLLNAPTTSAIYAGKRIAESSPAYMDSRKVRDSISERKKEQYPRGMGWEGSYCPPA